MKFSGAKLINIDDWCPKRDKHDKHRDKHRCPKRDKHDKHRDKHRYLFFILVSFDDHETLPVEFPAKTAFLAKIAFGLWLLFTFWRRLLFCVTGQVLLQGCLQADQHYFLARTVRKLPQADQCKSKTVNMSNWGELFGFADSKHQVTCRREDCGDLRRACNRQH